MAKPKQIGNVRTTTLFLFGAGSGTAAVRGGGSGMGRFGHILAAPTS
jgi:hypothetical protein